MCFSTYLVRHIINKNGIYRVIIQNYCYVFVTHGSVEIMMNMTCKCIYIMITMQTNQLKNYVNIYNLPQSPTSLLAVGAIVERLTSIGKPSISCKSYI